MCRLPYEMVANKLNRLIVIMATVPCQEEYWWDYYYSYLESCGWTDKDFDAETLKRINIGWSNS